MNKPELPDITPNFYFLDVTTIWSKVSNYCIMEDFPIYIKNLDKFLETIKDDGCVMLTGKSPIWLYGLVVARIIQKKPGITIHYSKPTQTGNRSYKIYPY